MAEPTGISTGTNDDYASLMPPLGNDADVQKAIQYYHYGNPDNAGLEPDAFPLGKDGGMARRLKDIKDIIVSLQSGGITQTLFTTKGDLVAATGQYTVTRFPAGVNGFVLKSNSNTVTGLEWYNLDSSHLPLVGGTLTGNLTILKDSPNLILSASTGTPAVQLRSTITGTGSIQFNTITSTRWAVSKDSTAEGGSNTGSDLVVTRYNDAGSIIDNPITVTRSTGLSTLASLSVTGTTQLTGAVTASSTVSASTAPTTGPHLTNKTYVDDQIATRLATAGGTLSGAVSGTALSLSGALSVGTTLGVTGIATFSNTVITVASNASRSGLRVLPGTAPSAPTNGDVWLESSRLYTRAGGATFAQATLSDKLSAFAATTSAELAGAITNETGTGLLVFNTSPALSGNPTAPTQAVTDNSTRIATTAFVQSRIIPRIYQNTHTTTLNDFGAHVIPLTALGWNSYTSETELIQAGITPTVVATSGDDTANLLFGTRLDTQFVYNFGIWQLWCTHSSRGPGNEGNNSRVNYMIAY